MRARSTLDWSQSIIFLVQTYTSFILSPFLTLLAFAFLPSFPTFFLLSIFCHLNLAVLVGLG